MAWLRLISFHRFTLLPLKIRCNEIQLTQANLGQAKLSTSFRNKTFYWTDLRCIEIKLSDLTQHVISTGKVCQNKPGPFDDVTWDCTQDRFVGSMCTPSCPENHKPEMAEPTSCQADGLEWVPAPYKYKCGNQLVQHNMELPVAE